MDSGNLLFSKRSKPPYKPEEVIAARAIIAAYLEMSYDAVALSARDLSAGSVFIQQTLNNHFPWVSANVTDQQGKSVVPGSIIKELEGITIGIIGLTDSKAFSLDDFLITNWRRGLSAEIENLKNGCDILIVLSTLSETDNIALSKEYNEVDIVITTTGSNRNLQPKHSKNTLFTQTKSRGKYLGALEINWRGGDEWYTKTSQLLLDLQNRLAAVDSQLHSLQRLEEEGKSVSSKKIARMTSYRRIIVEQIEAQETTTSNQVHKTEHHFSSSFIPVTPTEKTNSVADIVNGAKEEMSKLQ